MAETVIITGASRGIGQALVRRHVDRGDRVFGFDREPAPDGSAAGWFEVDVSDTDAVERATQSVWDTSGGVDRVYANAGIGLGVPLLKATPDQFRACFSVNLLGAWSTLRASATRMLAAKRPGKLCVTGSEHSLGFQHAGAGIYTASKHAVLGLADVLRHEVGEMISVSVLCPGLTATSIGETPDQSEAANAFGRAMMAEGVDAEVVARVAINGVDRGDFIITTHMASKRAWNRRKAEVDAAFNHVPEETQDADAYAVPNVVQRVRDRMRGGGDS